MEVYSRTIGWPDDPGFAALKKSIDKDSIKGAPDDRAFAIYRITQSIRDVPRDISAEANGKAAWKPGELAVDERYSELTGEQFALAHLDVVLYQPSIDSLKFVYERMSPRGIILCDDYGSVKCPGAKQAFNDFFEDKPENVIELPAIQALVVKA